MKKYNYEVTLKYVGNVEAKNKDEATTNIKESIIKEIGVCPEDSEINFI